MPIAYTIDSTAGVIFERWSGDVSAQDLAHYWRTYLADPAVLEVRRTIVDLRGANLSFTGLELADLVRTVVIPVLAGRDWITALVVDRPEQFGVSRQYQVFAEAYSRDAIFHEPEPALAWIRGVSRGTGKP